MADVQRWEDNGGMDGGMMRDPNGDYVEYSDYLALQEQTDGVIELFAEMLEDLGSAVQGFSEKLKRVT